MQAWLPDDSRMGDCINAVVATLLKWEVLEEAPHPSRIRNLSCLKFPTENYYLR